MAWIIFSFLQAISSYCEVVSPRLQTAAADRLRSESETNPLFNPRGLKNKIGAVLPPVNASRSELNPTRVWVVISQETPGLSSTAPPGCCVPLLHPVVYIFIHMLDWRPTESCSDSPLPLKAQIVLQGRTSRTHRRVWYNVILLLWAGVTWFVHSVSLKLISYLPGSLIDFHLFTVAWKSTCSRVSTQIFITVYVQLSLFLVKVLHLQSLLIYIFIYGQGHPAHYLSSAVDFPTKCKKTLSAVQFNSKPLILWCQNECTFITTKW